MAARFELGRRLLHLLDRRRPVPAFPFDDAAQAAGRFRQLLDDFGRLVPKLIQQGSAGPDDREEHEGGRDRPDDPRALDGRDQRLQRVADEDAEHDRDDHRLRIPQQHDARDHRQRGEGEAADVHRPRQGGRVGPIGGGCRLVPRRLRRSCLSQQALTGAPRAAAPG